MQQQPRVMIGVRHYHYPRIEFQIPKVPDYLKDWGGRSPSFNLRGDLPDFLPSLVAAWRRSLRRRGVPKLRLDARQQTTFISFLVSAGLLWKIYPLGFFLLTACLGAFDVFYRNLASCERRDFRWKNYRLISFYGRLFFWLLVILSLAYLRIGL